ncbi:MAG: hypothetical protein LBP33_07715 [Candidatus Adiutrix sp.]|jgi:chromosome segregation ATPase|nr:hypothetical protein [Candidatus Adiutrix sp.]
MAVTVKNRLKALEKSNTLTDLLPPGFDPHNNMRILGGYLRDLEAAYEELNKSAGARYRQLEGEYRALNKLREDQKQELDRLTGDLMEVTNTFEEQESLLSTLNQKTQNYEKQFKKLTRDNSDLANKLAQKENDANFYRQELARTVQENEALNTALKAANQKIDAMERRLAAEREAAGQHEKEARRMNLIISESQGKVALTERRLEEAVLKYSEEIRRLTERSSADAVHEVNLLRKRVRSSVAPEMRELSRLLEANKLTVESAHNFRAIVNRLITKLEQAGLELT